MIFYKIKMGDRVETHPRKNKRPVMRQALNKSSIWHEPAKPVMSNRWG
jgi:hypothetical protein